MAPRPSRRSLLIGRIGLVGVAGVLAAPLFFPIVTALGQPNAIASLRELDRHAVLLSTTLTLVTLTLAFALPTGFALAAIWCASDAAGRQLGRATLYAVLAIPLPVLAVAWQGVSGVPWSAFSKGLSAAVSIHAMAALPWVTLIVGAALLSADRAVADETALSGSAATILRLALRITAASVALAVVWVACQTAGEIVVTDVAQVRTFAEETYTQFVAPSPQAGGSAELALARAILATWPQTLVLLVALMLVARTLSVPRWNDRPESGVWLPLGRRRWTVSVLGWTATVALLACPILSLVQRTGRISTDGWSARAMVRAVERAATNDAAVIVSTLIAAGISAMVISAIVVAACLWARPSRLVRIAIFLMAALALATPGPVTGVGVKQAIDAVVAWEGDWFGPGPLRELLYDGTSLTPVIWAWAARAWPLGLAVLWSVVAQLPDDIGADVRLETRSNWQLARHALWPALASSGLVAAALMAVYSLGEVSASKLPATAGGEAFAHDLFARMHFGLTPDLAAACLLLVVACYLLAALVLVGAALARRRAARRSPPLAKSA